MSDDEASQERYIQDKISHRHAHARRRRNIFVELVWEESRHSSV